MIETDADRRASVRDLGERVEFDGQAIDAIFQAPYQGQSMGEMMVDGSSPALVVVDSTLPKGAGRGSVVSIRGTSYEVVDVQPDGEGVSVMRLMLS